MHRTPPRTTPLVPPNVERSLGRWLNATLTHNASTDTYNGAHLLLAIDLDELRRADVIGDLRCSYDGDRNTYTLPRGTIIARRRRGATAYAVRTRRGVTPFRVLPEPAAEAWIARMLAPHKRARCVFLRVAIYALRTLRAYRVDVEKHADRAIDDVSLPVSGVRRSPERRMRIARNALLRAELLQRYEGRLLWLVRNLIARRSRRRTRPDAQLLLPIDWIKQEIID